MVSTEKLQEGSSAQPFIVGSILSEQSGEVQPQGWALRSTKKATRFNAKQKGYLDEKFRIGEQSGHKADPAQVAKDMRHARHEDGNRRFTVDEFLTPQQIKSYFSRAAAKLRQRGREDEDADNCDFQVIEEQEAYSSTCAHVIDECQLIHSITYDTFNLCDIYATRKLTRLSISMLRLICSHFDMDIDNLSLSGKAPYMELIGNLVKTFSCT